RGGASDVIIGILRDKSTSVESLVGMAGDHTLQIHPQPTRGELRFAVEGRGNAEALLYDLLGRKLMDLPLRSDGTVIRGTMALGTVSPGMYMLVVRTADMVRSGKVVVTK
ncbi:MAG: T9SS type A sorting domain-containing protein, partial [Bacteroidetes bacterium]|nr:T9SS type A sorting domain-containing protein [Bacteroidota bacterium]